MRGSCIIPKSAHITIFLKRLYALPIVSLKFDYDLLGNILTVTYPDAASTEIDYVYNNAGQIEEITDYVDDFDYSPIGTTAYIEFANGITTTNTYDPNELYRLTSKITTDGVDDLQDISYTFDAVGNITAIADDSDTDAGKDAAYVYDDLHRLTSATITNTANSSNYTRTYAYTITGNINTKSDVGTYTYGNIHPHAVTSDGTNTYTYDNNGSLTGDGTWTYTYDTRNRLTQSADGSSTITYTYDEGRTRMTKSDGVATTTYVNDYYEKEGNVERDFILANGLKVATLEDDSSLMAFEGPVLSSVAALEEGVEAVEVVSEPETESPAVEEVTTKEKETVEPEVIEEKTEDPAVVEDVAPEVTEVNEPVADEALPAVVPVEPAKEETLPTTESLTTTLTSYPRIIFHHEDHLSGASVDTDENGDIVLVSDYYPYGAQRIEDKAAGYENDYLFTGQERDEETDLYYYGARYYDPVLGRFTSVDRWKGDIRDPQTLNKFSYARNNPLIYTDPSGNSAESVLATAWSAAFGVSMADSPLPGPADAVGLAVGAIGTIAAATVAVGELIDTHPTPLPVNTDPSPQVLDTPVSTEAPIINTSGNVTPVPNIGNTGGQVTPAPDIGILTTPAYEETGGGVCGGNMSCASYGNSIGGYEVSKHAIQRMRERGISAEDIEKAINSGESFTYDGDKTGYYDAATNTFVGVGEKITTVINPSKPENYIRHLKERTNNQSND